MKNALSTLRHGAAGRVYLRLVLANLRKRVRALLGVSSSKRAESRTKRFESHAFTAMRLALANPADTWINPAIALGESLLPRLDDPGQIQRCAVAVAQLANRLVDNAETLAVLDRLAARMILVEGPVFAVAQGYFDRGQMDRAYAHLATFLDHAPDNTKAIYRMAGILAAQAKPLEAIHLIQNKVPSTARDVEYNFHIGHIYAWSGLIDDARPWLSAALEQDPNHAAAIADLAFCDEMKGDYTQAYMQMDKASKLLAVRKRPQTMGLNTMHLSRLRRRMIFVADMTRNEVLARTLQRDAITRSPILLPYPVTEWNNGDLSGKSVVVLAELGIGDEIRYTCVYHRLLGLASQVWLSCDPRLQTLLQRSFPDFRVMPVLREFPGIKAKRLDERKLAVVNWMRKIVTDELIEEGRTADVWMRAMHQFESDALDHSRLHQSPDHPVLIPDPDQAAHFAAILAERAKGRRVVGLSWRGGRRTYNRDPHYFQIEQWRPLLQDPKACFVNLQYAVSPAELDWLREMLGERFIEFPELDLFDDMEGVAALCSQLDLVIAICTNVLELACAMGTPALYLMRSPQVTHVIRLNGQTGPFGDQQDSVWKSCRIIPRIDLTDDAMIDRARGYVSNHLAQTGNPAHLGKS